MRLIHALAGALALVCVAGSAPVAAQEFSVEKHYRVSFMDCDRASGKCERRFRPMDADNEVHCMIKAGMVAVVEWLKDRPGHYAAEIHCAKDGEAEL